LSAVSLATYLLLLASFSANANLLNNNKSASTKIIKLGMSNALSGPSSKLGQDLKAGASVYFNSVNARGGIHGKSIELISLDDGYEPERTVINTKNLLEQNVQALFGYVGTPTSHAIMPTLLSSQIPYLMPFTGADFLRSPTTENIFNLRASYYQEIKAQIEYLINIKKFTKIALVIQADEFGLTAQRAVNKILNKNALKLTSTARYRRNSDDIKSAITKISSQPVDAVVFVGTYQPLISLINIAHQQKLDILFTSLSFIGSHNVLNQIPESSKLLLTEVVPAPEECHWDICKKFILDMRSAGYNKLNRIQLEGYLNAFVFAEVAKNCKDKISSLCLIKQFKQYKYQNKSLKINFDNANRQGLQDVYFSFSQGASK
jgi:ABC-type branched-subunit amino acid transport system substrate-binding protein